MEKLQNAVIINGVVHELVDVDPGINECEICSLREICYPSSVEICMELFDGVLYKMFKKKDRFMKVTRHYESDHVILYVEEGEMKTCITLDNDRQLRRLGECLIDLERTGAREVRINEV